MDFKGRSVLEIGAGDGRLTRRIGHKAKSVLALDPLERDVLRAREAISPELVGRVQFLVAEIHFSHSQLKTNDLVPIGLPVLCFLRLSTNI